MNEHQAERIATATTALRPDWPAASIKTLIGSKLKDRAFLDVAVALAYVAADPLSRTPGRVLEPGPWWQVGTSSDDREPRRATTCRCGETHMPEAPCRAEPPTANVTDHLAAARTAVADAKLRRREADAERARIKADTDTEETR